MLSNPVTVPDGLGSPSLAQASGEVGVDAIVPVKMTGPEAARPMSSHCDDDGHATSVIDEIGVPESSGNSALEWSVR